MELIYSKVKPEILLHQVNRFHDIHQPRKDLINEKEFIQCSALKFKKGKTFKPHKHIRRKRTLNLIAQESWVVIKGSFKFFFYDLDDKLISEKVLNEGDASFTLQGGHNYEILEDNTIVYEYKTGPYEGQDLDKTFIGE